MKVLLISCIIFIGDCLFSINNSCCCSHHIPIRFLVFWLYHTRLLLLYMIRIHRVQIGCMTLILKFILLKDRLFFKWSFFFENWFRNLEINKVLWSNIWYLIAIFFAIQYQCSVYIILFFSYLDRLKTQLLLGVT